MVMPTNAREEHQQTLYSEQFRLYDLYRGYDLMELSQYRKTLFISVTVPLVCQPIVWSPSMSITPMAKGRIRRSIRRCNTKIEKAIEITKTGLEEYENPAVMWTGERFDAHPILHQSSRRKIWLRKADSRLHRSLPAFRRNHRLRRRLGQRMGYRPRVRSQRRHRLVCR